MAKKKPTPPAPDEPPRPRGRALPKSKGQPAAGTDAPSPAGASASPPGPKPRSKAARSNPDEALRLARGLALEALETFDPAERLALAKRSVATSRDCAEGYVLLAEMAASRKQALAYYEQAVEAGTRVLGPEGFREFEGSFWGFHETRPYMRARLGLAETLWTSGRRDVAVDHLFEMLRLNPGDNQGVRYILASWLLNIDRLDQLDDLLAKYDEGSTTWVYTKALVGFRRLGDSPRTRKLLTAAKKANKHVPEYLLGLLPLPGDPPAYYSPGDRDDAVLYVAANLSAWKSAAGAIAWVRSLTRPRKRKPTSSKAAGPSAESVARLRALPSELDAWQADFRQFPRRVEISGERVRPWMILVSSRTRELVLAYALSEAMPSAEEFWDVVARAMERPDTGEPHRPTELQVRPGGHGEALAAHFDAIGVGCADSAELDQINALFDDLARHMAGAEPPGMLDMPGVKPEQVGRFFEAAAEFYRRAPWRSLGYEAVIRIECDRYESGPWFAVIMGQSGLTLGLALYEDLALLKKMWAGKLSDEEGARKTVALTITFDDDASMSEADLEAIERFGWPVAAPEAYPSLFRKERGLSMRPPLNWEIDLMNACLRVLPEFVSRRSPDDTTRELVPVPGAAPGMELGLSWIEESY